MLDYLAGAPALEPFRAVSPDDAGVASAMEARRAFPTDRATLVRLLRKQYAGVAMTDAVRENIDALEGAETFTVCTAHQPALLTGALYFPYKILHAVRLAQHLQEQHPESRFVPVYYLGSEDNDLEELGTFRYGGKRYTWDGSGQNGAVGRMKTDSLQPLLEDFFKVLGPPGPHLDRLKGLITDAYTPGRTIAEGTRILVNALFGEFGLVVIDADEPQFKRAVMQPFLDDLREHKPYDIVTEQTRKLEEHYHSQAYPRPVNLFYLQDGVRERIEKQGEQWVTVDGKKTWNEGALMTELDSHPERFSPNVILRGLMQETILPNVAFIGGGSELAYWLQLRSLFDYYGVPYPAVVLRQSVQWIEGSTEALRKKLGISLQDAFKKSEDLLRQLITNEEGEPWKLSAETERLQQLLQAVEGKASAMDATLAAAARSAATAMGKKLAALEKKMYRAEKRKHTELTDRIDRLHAELLPYGGLQERTMTFLEFYPRLGPVFFSSLLANTLPYGDAFLVATEA